MSSIWASCRPAKIRRRKCLDLVLDLVERSWNALECRYTAIGRRTPESAFVAFLSWSDAHRRLSSCNVLKIPPMVSEAEGYWFEPSRGYSFLGVLAHQDASFIARDSVLDLVLDLVPFWVVRSSRGSLVGPQSWPHPPWACRTSGSSECRCAGRSVESAPTAGPHRDNVRNYAHIEGQPLNW
jgi:hypothetical protein